MPNTKLYTSILLTTALSLTSFSGCGTGENDDVQKGGFELRLTDAPIDDVESVLVTFDEVAVRRCVTEAESKDGDKDENKDGDKDENKDENKDSEKDSSKARQNDESTTGEEDASTEETTGSSDESTSADDKTGDETKEEDETGGNKDEDKDADKPVDDAKEEAETKSPKCVKEEWKVLSTKEMSFDLLKLQNGKTKRMVSQDIEAGTYNQLRLKLTKAELVIDGKTVELDVPSGSKSGLKVNAVFVIDAKNNSSMTVDFDAGKSLTRTGDDEWKLRPVLKAFKPVKTKREPEGSKDENKEGSKDESKEGSKGDNE